jgi:hypothetical protein
MTTFQKALRVFNRNRVSLSIYESHARCGALLDLVAETRSLQDRLSLFRDNPIAIPKVEYTVHEFYDLSNLQVGIRAKITGSIIHRTTADQNTREWFLNRQFQIGITLIVPKQNVVTRPMAFNEVTFKEKGLAFGFRQDKI